MFWIVAIAMAAMAAAFAAWPLLRSASPRRTHRLANRRTVMRALYRDRLAELNSEAAAGQLDPEVRAQVEEELSANLLDEYGAGDASTEAASQRSRRGGPIAALVLLVLLPATGLGVYFTVGEPDASHLSRAAEVLTMDPHSQRGELEVWENRLSRRVAGHPEEAQSWYLLGISRLQLGEFEGAAEAFSRAHGLTGNDMSVELYWLQSRYLADGGVIDAESRALAESILARRPNQPLVLEMFALDAYRQGQYRQAVEYLNRALASPMAGPRTASLMAGLEQARSRMGALSPSVNVQVSAPPGAPEQGTLFVIARPPGGGMPYAVVRRPAALMPLTVHLDDTVSMSEALRLSDAPRFEVVVRLSRSGRPTAGPGDWEWRSQVLEVADMAEPVTLDAELSPGGVEES